MRSFTPETLEAFNPNHGEGARHIEWSVSFEVIQDEAYDGLNVSAQENPDISRIYQTIDRNPDLLDIITFEQGGFRLDGSQFIPPGRSELPGAQIGLFMADLSDADGFFPRPQVYTATTAYPYDLLALTLDWGFVPAVDFSVEWYNGASQLAAVTVSGNAQRVSLVNHAVAGVNRVVISVTRGRAHSFARLSEFIPGAIVEYSPDNSDSLSLEENTDPMSDRATAGTLKLVVDNLSEQFDIFDPTGIYQYFKARMPLSPVISARTPEGTFQRVQMNKHYLQAPKLMGNLTKLQLEATDMLGPLQDTLYTKGIYKTATLAQFALDVANDAGVTISYPSSLNGTSLSAYIPTMSHAQAFAEIARASCTVLRVSAEDVLTFLPVGGTSDITLSGDDYRSGDGISPADDDIINTAEAEFQSYSLGTSAQVASMPASGTITGRTFFADNAVIVTTTGTYTPKYSPASNLSAAISGGELVITGQPLTSTPGVHTETSRRENERPYIYAVKSSPLIQAQNVQAVAQYALRRKADKRRVVSINYRGYPFLEVGDIMRFNTGGIDTQPFFMFKNRMQLGGGMTGSLEAREL